MTATAEFARNNSMVLEIKEEVTYRKSWETASNFSEYLIKPGTYKAEWVNLNGTVWNPDPSVNTPGYIANVGPYDIRVTVDATKVRNSYVNRLGSASSAHDEAVNEQTTVTKAVYAYTVKAGGPGPFVGSVWRVA